MAPKSKESFFLISRTPLPVLGARMLAQKQFSRLKKLSVLKRNLFLSNVAAKSARRRA